MVRWQILYGVFLILAGVAGYLSNPEKAKTALISGGTFGGLSIVWGLLAWRGMLWSRKAAIVTTAFLALVFTWRAAVAWMVVLGGNSGKLITACLISSMLTASIVLLGLYSHTGRRPVGKG
ncbi:MAG: hypothetical protein MOGMAGMI_01456 [Candidatus Omnitrophica bacterium]|nr:hypothetical protein [Candidatus Omnitrophota bacterium]